VGWKASYTEWRISINLWTLEPNGLSPSASKMVSMCVRDSASSQESSPIPNR